MRTSIAIIKLVLRTNKVLSDGTNPIMLRCSFNGMKEISTHYSCTPKYWDKKQECVKKGYSNWVMINHAINELKSAAIERRNEYERLGEVYTPNMILAEKKVLSGHKNVMRDIMMDYISDKCLKENTAKTYKTTMNLLEEFYKSNNIIVNSIMADDLVRFSKFLSSNKRLKDGSIRTIMSKIAAIISYAIEKGIADKNSYPFEVFKYAQKFKPSNKLDYIHHRTLSIMKDMLMDDIITRNNNGMWSYKGGVLDELLDKNSSLFARYLFMMMVLFQGLSQVDLCSIYKSEIEVKSIGGRDYYCWDGKRHKTNKAVKVRIPAHTTYTEMMVRTMLMFNNTEYLLPVLNGVSRDNEVAVSRRINHTMYNLSPKLKDWFKIVNREIIKRNVEDKDNIPLIDVEKCTFYTARHSFSQMYLAKGGNILNLASLLGRSMNGISTYVQQLSRDSELVEAVSIID